MLNRFALYTPIDAAANARRCQTFLRLSAEPLRLILVGTGMVSPFAETSSFKVEIASPDGCRQAGLEISWRPYPGSVKRAVGLTVVFFSFSIKQWPQRHHGAGWRLLSDPRASLDACRGRAAKTFAE